MKPYYSDDAVTLYAGDCREVLAELPDASIDAVCTDPPYELAFMGRAWDASGVAYDTAMWRECLRVLKPGGHLLAFGGTRTYHRMACAIEDAGFEVRDSIHWIYGSGMPKSHDVSMAIDKAAGATREVVATVPDRWAGKGTVLQRATQQERTEARITAPATDEARRWSGFGTALVTVYQGDCAEALPQIAAGDSIPSPWPPPAARREPRSNEGGPHGCSGRCWSPPTWVISPPSRACAR